MHPFQANNQGPAATFAKILQEAGFDLRDEKAMQWGMMAYNVAHLTWTVYEKGGLAQARSEGTKTGRNEPCPCGSGMKYKKCCLSRAKPLEQLATSSSRLPFGPRLIPNMTDTSAMLSDMTVLAEIMECDEELKNIRFSAEKISAFLEQNPPKKKKTTSADIDDLAFRYAKESGEYRLLKNFYDQFLKAAARAKSEDELRALSLGVLFAAQAETGKKDDDNLLSTLLFRREIAELLEPYQATEKMIDQLGGKDKILQRLRNGDISLKEELMSAMEALSQEEKEAAIELAEKDHEHLWKAVCSKDFPVKLPFVTMLPFFMKLSSVQTNVSEEELMALLENMHQTMTDEDTRLYASLLDRWLEENRKKRNEEWMSSVSMLRAAIMVDNFNYYLDGLVRSTLLTRSFSILNEEESEIMNDSNIQSNDAETFKKYGDLMDSLGYPKLAQRTRNYSYREGDV